MIHRTSKMDGGLIQMVIPADWDFAADDADASIPGPQTTGVTASRWESLISGVTDKTVRVELADDFDAGLNHHLNKHSGAYPQPPDRWRSRCAYEEYEFTASSRTRSGDLRELDPVVRRGRWMKIEYWRHNISS